MTNRYLPPFIMLGLTLVFAFLYMQEPKSPDINLPSRSTQGAVPYSQLEQYQKETAIKLHIKQEQADLNKQIQGPELSPGAAAKNRYHRTDFNKGIDQRVLDLNESNSYEAMTLDQKMDQFLAKKQLFDDMERAQKRAYAQAFIKEALAMGFRVEVNSDLEITSVERIDGQ